MELRKRKKLRLEDYDYDRPGCYFVTICTKDRHNILWEPRRLSELRVGADIIRPQFTELSQYGKVVDGTIRDISIHYPNVTVDHYVIMPNHIHAIFVLGTPTEDDRRSTLMDAVCAFKSLSVRECKKIGLSEKLFQTSFHDHVIRGKEDYDEIAEYIINNPLKWELDKLYMRDD